MTPRPSASPPARASSRALAALAALAFALGAGAAAAQQPAAETGGRTGAPSAAATAPTPVLVVDLDRALRESAAAVAQRAQEAVERRALREKLDGMKRALEAEEAEMVVLRDTLPKEAFDKRVTDFDQRVRAARRVAQEEAAALQARIAAAQTALRQAAQPLMEALMRERGAVLVIDRNTALAVAPEFDATDALIARLDAAQPAPPQQR